MNVLLFFYFLLYALGALSLYITLPKSIEEVQQAVDQKYHFYIKPALVFALLMMAITSPVVCPIMGAKFMYQFFTT